MLMCSGHVVVGSEWAELEWAAAELGQVALPCYVVGSSHMDHMPVVGEHSKG